jgi:hypothetical protein
MLAAAGCSTPPLGPRGAQLPGTQSTSMTVASAIGLPATETGRVATVTEAAAAPTQDMISLLVTQAYSQVTVTPRATEPVLVTSTPTLQSPINIAHFSTPTPTQASALASVIFSEPVQITNAVNTADCKIRGVGDCTTTMQAGNTLFFTWTFGVQGPQSFSWGQAAVVVARNGETYTWTQTGNMLVSAPDSTKDEYWTLAVGQSAQFAGSLDNPEPGQYTARLMMCTLSPAECNAGQGWQNVGGAAIRFVIES